MGCIQGAEASTAHTESYKDICTVRLAAKTNNLLLVSKKIILMSETQAGTLHKKEHLNFDICDTLDELEGNSQ